ncbi:MAG: hypothetical protein WCJ35_06730 [Planctomycetota bacterium]
MANEHPTMIVLAGPNGSGKTTAAPRLLPSVLGVVEFVNADTIAQGLAAFGPELVALEAGAIMLSRLRQLADQRRTFAFETTLAGRSLAHRDWFGMATIFTLCFYGCPVLIWLSLGLPTVSAWVDTTCRRKQFVAAMRRVCETFFGCICRLPRNGEYTIIHMERDRG